MAHPAGRSWEGALKVDFGRRLRLRFCGSVMTSDAGLLTCRELDDAPGLTETAGEVFVDGRTGRKGRRAPIGLLRQAACGRLASDEDANDAEPLRLNSATRSAICGKTTHESAASPSQTGRSSPDALTAKRTALVDLSGRGLIVFALSFRREASCSTWIRQLDAWRTGNERRARRFDGGQPGLAPAPRLARNFGPAAVVSKRVGVRRMSVRSSTSAARDRAGLMR